MRDKKKKLLTRSFSCDNNISNIDKSIFVEVDRKISNVNKFFILDLCYELAVSLNSVMYSTHDYIEEMIIKQNI